MKQPLNICSVSGGKDSTALYLLMQEYHGKDFLPIFANTGHEHPVTLNYVRNLHHMTGGPEVQIVEADFESRLVKKGIKPSGNTFLDMMLWKHAVPTSKMQFCTEHLKLWPILFYLNDHYANHEWLMHTGIRAGESKSRSVMQPFMFNDFFNCMSILPMLYNSEDDEFDILESYGVPPNPLYLLGNSRVGCYPCIYANKDQLSLLPDWAWERLEYFQNTLGIRWFTDRTIEETRDWCKTSHGGKQFDMFRTAPEDAPSCMTGWIACE